MDIIVGTAGHIDHGKTALVRALSGTDTDRLPEEKQRGITIDIGFAELSIGSTHFGFVDVPGHERFVKNMLAGASGIDLVLLVIAADEGVMPQTREHFEICRLLGLKHGIVVLTKKDLVDAETLELAHLDADELVAGSFLETAPIVEVCAVTGDGIEDLKRELLAAAERLPERTADRITFMPIDRSFSVKGFGAVVTGTIASGGIAEGTELDLLPDRRKVRVRGVQTHGRKVSGAAAGQRTAVNLGGIDHSEIERGKVLAEPGVLEPTQMFAAEVEVLSDASKPLKTRQRVRVHIGTAEVLGRVLVVNNAGEIAPGSTDFIQLTLETPIACLMGDRFILRRYSPQATIAGGRVLIPHIPKLRRKDIEAAGKRLEDLVRAGDDKARIIRQLIDMGEVGGRTLGELQTETGWTRSVIDEAAEQAKRDLNVVTAGERLVLRETLSRLQDESVEAVREFHLREPLAGGLQRESLREKVFRYLPADLFSAVVSALEASGKLVADKDVLRLADHKSELDPAEAKIAGALRSIYDSAGIEPPKLDDALARAATASGSPPAEVRKVFNFMLKTGEIVKVSEDLYFSSGAIDRLKSAVREFAERSTDRVIDVPRFKEIAGVSRKYAIPMLEYFDRERVTMRAGDKRVVLK